MSAQNSLNSWLLPLSGNVSQPWSWWTDSMSQVGFINVNEVQSSDPRMEKEIVENVAGYGKQLGRITEALEVLCERVDTAKLRETERRALREFSDMAAEIAAVKAGGSAATEANLDRLISGLHGLKQHDPEQYARVTQRLRSELFSGEGSPARGRARS